MTDTKIGYIDYSEMNVDKNATYDSLKGRVVVITGAGQWMGASTVIADEKEWVWPTRNATITKCLA